MLPRRLLVLPVLTIAATAAAFFATAGPAAADPVYVPSSQSGAVVPHLNLAARTGYVNLALTVGVGDQIVGLTVTIPAAGGTWQPVPSRTFTAPGLTCTSATGAALAYTCHTPILDSGDGPMGVLIPTGSYQLSLPANRPTGSTSAITGTVSLVRAGTYGSPDWTRTEDTFPVTDATTPHSGAETRELDTWNDGTWALNDGVLSMSVQIAAGEKVTGLYIDLPQGVGSGWTVKDRTFTDAGGVDCGSDADYPADPANYVISCHAYARSQQIWPTGTYQLTLHVADVNDLGTFTGVLKLRQLGGTPYPVDSFPIYNHDGLF
jgi:hypothetical protein